MVDVGGLNMGGAKLRNWGFELSSAGNSELIVIGVGNRDGLWSPAHAR